MTEQLGWWQWVETRRRCRTTRDGKGRQRYWYDKEMMEENIQEKRWTEGLWETSRGFDDNRISGRIHKYK